MSQGFDTPVSKQIIAIETDDAKYFVMRIKKEAKEATASGKNIIYEE